MSEDDRAISRVKSVRLDGQAEWMLEILCKYFKLPPNEMILFAIQNLYDEIDFHTSNYDTHGN